MVILTQLFCTFAAYLYIGMLLQYLFMPVGWYFYDYGLISAVPTVGLNCCDFWAQLCSRLKQTFISLLRGCFCKNRFFFPCLQRGYKLGSIFFVVEAN